MKKYEFIRCENISKYKDWEIIQIIPKVRDNQHSMAVVMKEDKLIQNYIKLHEATTEQLLEEIHKRLENK